MSDPDAPAKRGNSLAYALGARVLELSTAIKVFLILGLALFPLGLLATLASFDAMRDGRSARDQIAKERATGIVRGVGHLIDQHVFALRLAAASANPSDPEQACRLLEQSSRTEPTLGFAHYAIFDASGKRLCSTRGLPLPIASVKAGEPILSLDTAERLVIRASSGSGASAYGIIDPVDAVGSDPSTRIFLQDDRRSSSKRDGGTRARRIVSRLALARSDVSVVASTRTAAIGTSELVSILWPFVMLLAAATLGWLIVDRLLLRPIVGLRRAVLAYRPGGPPMVVPKMVTPVTEIRDLGLAFSNVTGTIARHEAELEAAVVRQVRLVREVHHRVKNNLQVVASLLNLHARGARSVDAAEAYASIQRRVDALAVVHRSHFAELEDGRGVAMRPLISELTGNLRATAPASAMGMAITLDLDQVFTNQDVAVSVAFLVTEVVEHAMMCTPDEPVNISLSRSGDMVARLVLSSASLKDGVDCVAGDPRQFERITTGLSRQLRTVLERNTEIGFFGIDIAVLEAVA